MKRKSIFSDKRLFWGISSVWVVLLMVLSLSFSVLAAVDLTASVGVSGLMVSSADTTAWTSSSTGSTSWTGTTTSKQSGCSTQYTPATGSLTLTNDSGEAKTFSFDYTVTLNGGSVTIDGSNATTNGSFAKTLASGSSVVITTSSSNSAKNTTTVTLSNIKLEVQQVTTTFEPSTNGSYTVDSTKITATLSKTGPSTTTYALAATPAVNYQFAGWYVGETLYSTDQSIPAAAFANGGTVTAKFDLDPLYKAITVAEGTTLGKGDLVEINSRYYHDPSTHLINSITSGNFKESFYTVNAGTKTDGAASSQRIPSLGWTAGTGQVSVSKTVTADGEYVASVGNSWVYGSMTSDVIRIYAKEDCVISFDYLQTITENDLSMNTADLVSRIYMLQSKNGNLDFATIAATTNRFPATEDEYTTYLSTAKSVVHPLPKGEYLYIFTNGYTETNEFKFGGYATKTLSYSATLSNFTVAANEVKYTQTTRFADNLGKPLTGGVLNINGTNYNAEADATVASLNFLEDTVMKLSVATVPNNYRFIGWQVNGNQNLIPSATYEYTLTDNITVNPVFAPDHVTLKADGTYQYPDQSGNTVACNGEVVARNAGGTAFYTNLDTAFSATDVVVLLGNMTIEGNYTVPAGKTLVVPNATDSISATLESGQYIPSVQAVGSGQYVALTVKGNLTVNGTVLVAGYQYAGSGGPTGIYGTMTVNGKVTVNSGGALYGYGLVNGSGTILAKSGAQVHELCEILDKRHPVTMQNLINNGNKYRVTPFNILHINTIEAKTTYEKGATLDGHFSVSWGIPCQGSLKVIDTSAAVFVLTEGSLSKYYDPFAGQTVYRVDESSTVETGNVEVVMDVIFGTQELTAEFNSADFMMPLSAGWQLRIAGNFNVTYNYKVLPGAMVDVESTGVMNIANNANLVFYRLNDYDYRSNANTDTTSRGFTYGGYPYNITRYYTFSRSNIGSAKLNVNGIINANGGLYVTEQLIAEYTATDPNLSYQNYTRYDNGYNFLTGTGTINMGTRTSTLTQIYENLTNGQTTDAQITTVAVVPMKGLKADATANEPEQYETLSGTVKGRTNENGMNVWGADPCEAGHTPDEGVEEKAATCMEEGNIAYWTCTVCERTFSDAECTVEVTEEEIAIAIDPNAHIYGAEGKFAWAAEHSTCTVTVTCSVCTEDVEGHTATFDCEISEETTDASCTEAGKTIYTATYTLGETVYTDKQEVEIVAAGHSYGNATYTWSEDGKSCTATGTCSCGDENTATAAISSAVKTAATCTAEGTTTYTATFTETWAESQTKDVQDIAVDATNHTNVVTDEAVSATCTTDGKTEGTHCGDCNTVIKAQTTVTATGHSYGDATYTWSEDNSKCTASRSCSCGDEQTAEATVGTSTVDATCTNAGSTTKTATFEASWASAQTKSEPIAALGCNYDGGVVTTAPTCTVAGVKTFTCATCGGTKTESIPSTGHTYGAVTYNFADDGESCTASRVCANDASHVENATATISGEVTKAATCIAMGETTYTATFAEDWAATQTKTVADAAMIDHADAENDGNHICDTEGCSQLIGECSGGTATCTEAATCSECGQEYGNALGHNMVDVAEQSATCNDPGYSAHKACSRCDYTEGKVTIPATDHKYTTYTSDGNATCTADGTKTAACDNGCGTKDTVADEGTMLEHSYTVEVSGTRIDATCVETGSVTMQCATCTATQVQTLEIDPNNHVEIKKVATQAPTCSAVGWEAYEHCTGCTYTTYKELAADETAHSWGDWSVTTPASCTAEGEEIRTCANNSAHTETQPLAKLSHSMTYHARVDTTCVAAGNVEYWSCSACQFNYNDELGTTKLDSVEIAIDPNAHDLMTVPAQTATCTQIGWAEYQKCQREGCEYSTYEEISKLDHSYSIEQSRTDATCVAEGSVTYKCATCTATQVQTLEIDPNNHVEIKKVDEQAPTCSAVGWEAYEHCTECTYTTYKELAVNADAHSWGDWSVTTSATCTAEGVETRTCAHNSAHTETNPIAKLSHSMTHHARVDTTCVAAGNVEYWSCSACNLTYSDEPGTTKLDSVEIPIDPDAHDLMTVPAQTATCTQIGWAEYQKCQRDGCDHSTYVEIPMLAHSYTTKASERLKDAATCTTAATYYVRCDHCTAVSTDKTVTVGEAKGHTEATSYVHIENTTTHNVVVSCSVCTANISTTPQNCADEDNDFKCDKCKALLVNAYTDYVDFCPEFSGEKTVDGTAVTLKYTGEVAFAPAAGNGTWNHWFGFKVTAPTGVSVANVTILRPDGETRVMENIKDGDDFAYLYWGMTKDEDKTAAYQIDWNGDGTYDLTVTLDATAATLKECEHSYDEGEVTTAPGCETAGEKTYTCANCGDIKTEPVEATGHKNTVIQNASEATCGKDGYTGDTYCNDCQMTIETGSVISATGNHTWDNACDTDCNVCGTTRETEHQWNEGVETTAPTCTAAGVKTFTCTVDGCGATKTEAIAATGHSHSTEWSKDETHHWHECACGNKGDYDVHKWNDGVETTAPTTSAPGVMTYTCSVCGATKAEEIAQLTGTMVDIDVVTKDLTSGPQIALLSGTTAGDGWSYEGSVIAGETVDFTVTFDKACVVVVATTDADGNVTYARQTATATENENTYKFSIDTSEGMEIIVAVKGDANGDGKITNADANMTKAFVLGNATPITTMGEIICDVNNKGGITNADSNMIKAYVLGNYVPITW